MIEVIVALFILSLAVIGSFILIQQTLIGASANQMRLTASYLGQEGLEIVRNIRDTNWLKEQAWTMNLAVNGGAREADYQSTALENNDRYLKISTDGFYNYNSGTDTTFKRKIFVTQEACGSYTAKENCEAHEGCYWSGNYCEGYLKVRVRIEWQERGKDYSLEVIDFLYNWYVI